MTDKSRSESFGINREVVRPNSGLTNQQQGPEPTRLTHYSLSAPPELRELLDSYRDAVIRYAIWQPSDGPDAMQIAVKVDADTREAYLALVALFRRGPLEA